VGWAVSLVRLVKLRRWTLFTASRHTLRANGTAWLRLGPNGPGLRLYDTSAALPFSLRVSKRRALRLGRYAITWMPAVGKWP
jgi:hypothetical protein